MIEDRRAHVIVGLGGLIRHRQNTEADTDMDQTNLADLYSLDLIPWSRALEALESAQARTQTPFLATTRPDGRPHVAAVGALWDEGKVYFTSGSGTRKSRNLAQNANCVISMSLPGIDLVVEGTAAKLTDDPTLQRLAKRYADQGWPATVKDGAFTYEYSAPSAGPPPWDLYAVTPTTIFGVLTVEPGGATRWRFGGVNPAR
jgi:general stress protein 26